MAGSKGRVCIDYADGTFSFDDIYSETPNPDHILALAVSLLHCVTELSRIWRHNTSVMLLLRGGESGVQNMAET